MIKILLVAVNAKYIHSNPAIYYLRSYALQKDERLSEVIRLAEFTVNQGSEEILSQIYREKPDMVAFSCYIWNITIIEELLAELPKILPDTDIWLGGPEVSFDAAERLRRNPAVTGIMTGEGEAAFYEVAESYRNRQGEKTELLFLHIPGILYRGADSSIAANPAREYLDFDMVPFPYQSLEGMEHRIIYYETSRGCPFACSYCLSSVDRKVRLRSLELVRKELQFFLDAKVAQVKFVDRTFNCNAEHTKAIWEYIRDHDNGITNFHFEIAAELLREEELELLASLRPGLVQMEIGVQTANPDTLAAICRKADMKHLSAIVERLTAAGNMHIHLDLIAGLPYEDLVSFRNSFDQVYRLHPEQLQLGFLKVLKGSPMERDSAGYGIMYREKPPYEVLSTNWLSYEDIRELKQVEEMLETYYNSGQFLLAIQYLEHFYKSPYELYRELAVYGAETGWNGRKHNRYDWYEHLRRFWLEQQDRGTAILPDKQNGSRISEADDGKQTEIITTLLLHDLYARENVKSRPAYAPPLAADAEEKWRQRGFFESGVYREYLPGYEAYTSAQTARMVHLEKVELDPFRTAETGERVAWNGYLLYDYRSMDAVTHNAVCRMIPAEYLQPQKQGEPG